MRILLVKPRVSDRTISGKSFVELEPLELEYLAGALPDHDVQLLDMRFDSDLERAITAFQPDIVGTTAYSVHVYNALAVARTAKRIDQRILTVVGGHHATLVPEDFNRKEIDVIVIGEGVLSFRDVVQSYEQGLPLQAVPGLALPSADGLTLTEARDDADKIDLYPLPDRRISAKHRADYFYLWWKPAALIRASVGCAYRCSFCPIWKAAGGKCRYRSPELVASELAGITEGFVYFCDENAFFDKQKMEVLHALIRQGNIRKEYFMFCRPDALTKCPELVERWAEIGLRQVFVGIETRDGERMKDLNKRIDADTNKEAIRILKRNGIDPFAGLMVFPDFTAEDFARLYDYLEELGVYYFEITVLTPAPATELYRSRKEDLVTQDYELFDYMHAVVPTRLEPKDFYRALADLYLRGYSPFRAARLRPARGLPLRPIRLAGAFLKAARDYVAIRNAHRAVARSYSPLRNEEMGWKP